MSPLATNPRSCSVIDAPTLTLLYPGASWSGTAGSGGTAPAESATLLGSGWEQKVIGNFDEPPLMHLEDDTQITVICDTGDDAWIDSVTFWLEGRTTTVTQQVVSARTEAIGFSCIIDHSEFVSDGDAQLYAYIRPVNGYERRIGPLTITKLASRPVRYINWASGSDATGDGVAPGTAWKTFVKAQSAAPNGAVVYCSAGTYLEDLNSIATNSNARLITFRRVVGLALGDVKISRTSRTAPETRWMLRAAKLEFDGIWIDMAKIPYMQNISNATAITIFRNCNIEDSNGVTGPLEGYPSINDSFQAPFRAAEGQYTALLESTLTNFNSAGLHFIRNSTLNTSGDTFVLGNYTTSRDSAIINTQVFQLAIYASRMHEPVSIVVATATYNSGPNTTTVTWSGSPVLYTAVEQPNQDLNVLTGSLTGNAYHLISQTPATFTTVVQGNASGLAIGDTCRVMFGFHADTMQQNRQLTAETNIENVILQRYKVEAISSQLIFLQAGAYVGAGTVATSGTSLTCSTTHGLIVGDFVKLLNGSQAGEGRRVVSVDSTTTATLRSAFGANQTTATWIKAKTVKDFAFQLCIFDMTGPGVVQTQWQDGHHHLVMRQCVHIGDSITLRNPVSTSFAFCLEDVVIKDCIIETLTSDNIPFPSAGLIVDNNHFETGTARGTNSSLGAVVFDSDYRPTSGVARTIPSPKLHFNALGEALNLDGTDKVGALG